MQNINLSRQKRGSYVLLAGLLLASLASAAVACSTVMLGLPERPLIAYSYDFGPFDGGLLITNAAGLERQSIMETNPAVWTADHDSLTFTQFGPGMPMAGMNRAGLVVSLMWNDEVRYARLTNMPAVNELEFIQRLLDMSSTVQEALQHAGDVSIHGLVPVHFLLADAEGNTAILKPNEQGLESVPGAQMPIPALTNTSYQHLLEELSSFAGFGGARQIATNSDERSSSTERFAIAASAHQAGLVIDRDQAFAVLDDLANQATRWQFVFDPVAQLVSVRPPSGSDGLTLDLQTLDFVCEQLPSFLDLSGLSQATSAPTLSALSASDVQTLLEGILSGFGSRGGLHAGMAPELSASLLQSAHCPI